MHSISIFLLLFSIIITVSIIYTTVKQGISPMPSSYLATKEMVSHIKEGQRIVDLGAGWGTLLFHSANIFPYREVIGVEISLFPYLFSLVRLKLSPGKNISLIFGTIYNQEFKEGDTILCYLYPKGMEQLSYILKKRGICNITIISNTFSLPYFEPTSVTEIPDLYRSKIYCYDITYHF